uniref:Anaphase promoting complex subunit 7 n=1 Tax=Plectus sambesii TaxID=2011161 RepID=A0A914UQF3_9BILA
MLSETFEYMKRLHNDELYEDVITLGSFAMTALERNTDASLAQRCQCVVYYADALYNLDQFKKSEQAYYRALQMRKSMTKPLETRKHAELTSEADIRFRLHQCLMRQGKHQEAMGVLESIPDQQRTPKVRAALGRLYANEERRNANLSQQRRSGKVISNALLNYKRLLKDVPFAFETLATFLQVGGGLEDAEAAVASVSSELDWVDGWISAQGALARRDLASAAHHLRDLLAQSSISNNARLVAELGRVYHLAGERSKAIIQLQRAHSLDPFSVKGMDILAALLSEVSVGM